MELLELCLKFQTWHVIAPTYVVSENSLIPFSTKALLILLIFAKNQRFFAKIIPLLKAIV